MVPVALNPIPPVFMKLGLGWASRLDGVPRVRYATGNRTRRLRNPT